jgi:hypothetical protein
VQQYTSFSCIWCLHLGTKTFIRDNRNFDSSEFDSTGVKLYIFIHNEVPDFDKNSTQPELHYTVHPSQIVDAPLEHVITFNIEKKNHIKIVHHKKKDNNDQQVCVVKVPAFLIY